MKIGHIIFLLISIGYIYCVSDIQDISLSTNYDIDTSELPKGIIPKDTSFYFRLEITDDSNKNIQISSNTALNKDSFIVKIGYFEEKPDGTALEKEEEWETAEYIGKTFDSNKNISSYSAKFKENTKFFLISVQLKSDFDSLSIFVKNSDEEQKKNLEYKIKYSPKKTTLYTINLTDFDITKDTIALRLMEEHVGEVFLHFIVKHDEEDLKLDIKAIGLETNQEEELEKEKEKENPNYIDILLNEKLKEDYVDFYTYRFTLEKEKKYVYIFFKLNMELEELTFYLDFDGGEVKDQQPLYNISKFEKLKIDLEKLYNSKYKYFTLKSAMPNEGDMILKLETKNNVPKEAFFLEGFGNEQYVPINYEGNSTNLNIEFNSIDKKGKEYFHQYHFLEDISTGFFTINVYVKQNIDELWVRYERVVTFKERFGAIIVALIVFTIILILFIILFLLGRKCGFLNIVTSKEIKSGAPI